MTSLAIHPSELLDSIVKDATGLLPEDVNTVRASLSYYLRDLMGIDEIYYFGSEVVNKFTPIKRELRIRFSTLSNQDPEELTIVLS